MAKRKTQQDKTDQEVKLELTPMIDVTFLLLAFFILTMKFRVLEGKLDAQLPKDMGPSQARTLQEDRPPIRIRLQLLRARVEPPALRAVLRRQLSHEALAQAWRDSIGEGNALQRVTTAVRVMVGNNAQFDLLQQTTFVEGNPRTQLRFLAPGSDQDQPAALERLRKVLRGLRDNTEDQRLLITPDRAASYGAMMLALEAAQKAGYKNVTFSGAQDGTGKKD